MKRFTCLCLCIILLSSNFVFGGFRNKAFADPITAAQVASTAYAIMSSAGISFTAADATGIGLNSFLSGQVDEFATYKQSSISEYFAGRLAVNAAGKLVVGQTLYNAVVDFIDWLSDKFGLGDTDSTLKSLDYEGTPIDEVIEGAETWTGEGVGGYFSNYMQENPPRYSGFHTFNAMNGSQFIQSYSSGGTFFYAGTYSVVLRNNALYAIVPYYFVHNGAYGSATEALLASNVTLEDGLTWNGENYIQPTVINPSQEWIGDIEGYSVPDTNLDQLLGDINDAIADNNLVVDGEVIDIPVPPEPSPSPIDPVTPLSDVPWEGLDNNLQDLYNQGLEEIGAIGDAQDAITDAVAEQTGALEGAIADNAGVVSGAIDQAVSDIQDAISEQTQTLSESASATAEATESIAEALEDEAINWQKFDLRGLFPFCIPFDIYNMLEALDASPTAPHVQLPFVIESIGFSYTIDLDFSSFDAVAAVMRQMELIVYGIALAWATSKVIKW